MARLLILSRQEKEGKTGASGSGSRRAPAPGQEPFQLFVKTLTGENLASRCKLRSRDVCAGKTITLDCTPNDTIESIKDQIEEREGEELALHALP